MRVMIMKRMLKVAIIVSIFAGSFFGVSLYVKKMVTQIINNEFKYHMGSAKLYASKQDLPKFMSHYLHAVTWARRYEKIKK